MISLISGLATISAPRSEDVESRSLPCAGRKLSYVSISMVIRQVAQHRGGFPVDTLHSLVTQLTLNAIIVIIKLFEELPHPGIFFVASLGNAERGIECKYSVRTAWPAVQARVHWTVNESQLILFWSTIAGSVLKTHWHSHNFNY